MIKKIIVLVLLVVALFMMIHYFDYFLNIYKRALATKYEFIDRLLPDVIIGIVGIVSIITSGILTIFIKTKK